jgi:rhodanese-related sulfurtransferase
MSDQETPEVTHETQPMSPRAKKVFFVLFAATILFGCYATYQTVIAPSNTIQTKGQIINLTASEMYGFINNSCKCLAIIDVRTPEEFATGHLNRSININWKYQNFTEKISVFNRENPIVVYCGVGARSYNASKLMTEELGFQYVYNMVGGLDSWKRMGYLVINNTLPVIG